MKGLRQHTLDFEIIPTGNPKTLVFIDSSSYFQEPEKPLLEVTLPGYSKYFLLNVTARKVNTFNSNTIGLTDLLNNDSLIDLPDGVYSFRYKICPYTYLFVDKKFFRTTLLEQKIANLYNQIDATDCAVSSDKVKDFDIIEIHSLLEGAKAVVNKNEKKASSFYQLADSLATKLLEKLSNKNCR